MKRDQPLLRQWLLLKSLCSNRAGCTLNELAAEHGVGTKTIRRDLATLESVGFPLESRKGAHGCLWWSVPAQWNGPGVAFQVDEALALYMGRQFFEPLAGTLFWQAAQSAFRKLKITFGERAIKYIEKAATAIYHSQVGISDYGDKADIIDQLMIGIEDRKAAFITYQSVRSTEPTTYDVHPYGLAWHNHSLYLAGYSPQHDEIRHWKIDRMIDAETTLVPFQFPAGFSLQDHFANSFGVWGGAGNIEIVIRFSAAAARYVAESKWHRSQQLETNRDGSVTARFQLSDTTEIKTWIMSFGKEAEVLAPTELREELAEEYESLLLKYSKTRQMK